ncbi:hypothetical protein E1180_11015 [Roseibium denhamense]|nr:hypothetical protein [Roseibium denhamense]MTI06043.1 hypothetical protein [Roseibium denhamense]
MSVALFDYAMSAQEVLGHESVVFYSEEKSVPAVVEKFKDKLNLVPVPAGSDLRTVSEPYLLDFAYSIREGRKGSFDIAADRTGIHAVFRHFEPHGDVYAYVSQWLANWMSGGRAPAVPHIVDLPEPSGTMREELNIPKDAFVVGRYGGFDQFNVPFARKAVREAIEKRRYLYFVFVNTEKFLDHERALFLPPIVNVPDKVRFIAACDVGLNAKKIGESFGLAIAEFLMLGKPVFSWAGGMDQNHVHMSPKSEWLYRTRHDLSRLLTSYRPSADDMDQARRSVECYRPDPVMRQFEKVFLSGGYCADDLSVGRLFKLTRYLEEKAMRAKFRVWKSL